MTASTTRISALVELLRTTLDAIDRLAPDETERVYAGLAAEILRRRGGGR
jgi:hypothetical protein